MDDVCLCWCIIAILLLCVFDDARIVESASSNELTYQNIADKNKPIKFCSSLTFYLN